ncbi:MAG: hypothetical protein GY861_21610 [bacterium]|nr:hypothetical protein [bacterium]
MENLDFYWKWFENPGRFVRRYLNKLFGRNDELLISRAVQKYRGQLVIIDHQIARFIGWSTIEDNFCWIFYSWDWKVFTVFCSDSEFVPLSSNILKYSYYRLDFLWNNNGRTYERAREEALEYGLLVF